MIDQLREYVEELFKNAPLTKQAVEIKEEILQNTIDRYNDLIAEGKTEQAAYNIAIAGIGDVEHLINNLMAPKSMSGYSKEEIIKNKSRNSMLLAISVMLYILCVLPVIIFSDTKYEEPLGVCLMFVMIAVATGLLIYRSKNTIRYTKSDDTIVENFKEWNYKKNEDKSLFKAISAAAWSIIVVIYFLVSFTTMAWHITWLIFLIGGAIVNIIKACFELRK